MDKLRIYPNDDDYAKRGRGTIEDFEKASKQSWKQLIKLFKRK